MIVTFPSAFLLWFSIHPFIHFWRRLGATVTYVVNIAAGLALMYAIFLYREPLLAIDYGANRLFVGIGVVIYACAAVVEVRCRKHLTVRMLVGVPEVKAEQEGPGKLLQEGIYSRVRHPRYLGVMLACVALAFLVNYQATWILLAALFPIVWALMVIEERELRERFGNDYDEYSARVPRIIPRLRSS
jgi:protein-S-isoprenylcysteine O-methyltransferase Ste14